MIFIFMIIDILECKMDSVGKNYTGKTNETLNKISCMRWDQQYPHKHKNNGSRGFPEQNASLAMNYCRNPDNEPGGPWCYTVEPTVRWEYCEVPYCSKLMRKTYPN